MKDIEKAIEKVAAFVTPQFSELLMTANKKVKRLEESADQMLRFIESIRYQEWPTIGLGIGLEPEPMDEIIKEATLALKACDRKYAK